MKLSLQLDTGRVLAQIETLTWLVALLPQRVAHRFRHKAHCLLLGVEAKSSDRRCGAAQTGDGICVGRVLVEVPGLDELIAAAARRAAKRQRSKRNGVHGGSFQG